REWFDYASTRVPNMQLEKMKAARGLGLSLSFTEADKPFTEGNKRVSDVPGVERRLTQTPRVFYRRESEARPLIVAKR
ncbi:MAG: hypothetical protein ABJB61_02310, partial [bacterium]